MNHFKIARPPALISICLVVILVAAIFLRFYHFKDTFLFLGDQGRDSLIARGILIDHNLVFIGPVTSVGNLYLGPFYYYFMVPFLWLTYPSPIGPGLAVAAVNVLAVLLMYVLGKEIVGKRAAMLGAFFYAFSYVIVTYSRFSWNPNITAPVTVLIVWCLWRAWKKNPWYWLGVAFFFSILSQLHYIALSILGGIGIIWLVQLRMLWLTRAKNAKKLNVFIKATALSLLIFAASLTPLALFNYKHNGLIISAFVDLFTKEKVLTGNDGGTIIDKIRTDFQQLVFRSQIVIFGSTIVDNMQVGIGLLAVFVLSIAALIRAKTSASVAFLVTLLLPCLIAFALYKGDLYDHYFVFVLPVLFLLWGILLAKLSRSWLGAVVVVAFLAAYLAFNLPREPLTGNGVTIDTLAANTQNILTHLGPNEQFSLLLLSGTKDVYGSNYRYFFTAFNRPPADPALESSVNTLVVINEDAVPDVPKQDIYELNIFPNRVPSEVYTIPQGPQVLIFRK